LRKFDAGEGVKVVLAPVYEHDRLHSSAERPVLGRGRRIRFSRNPPVVGGSGLLAS
jgi:hypothetical protein